jgi:hypothetical protein
MNQQFFSLDQQFSMLDWASMHRFDRAGPGIFE